MVRDLLRQELLKGRTDEETRQLLGEPRSEWTPDATTRRWAYTLGDSGALVVYLGANRRVRSVFVDADDD